jgi:hypothetical protein
MTSGEASALAADPRATDQYLFAVHIECGITIIHNGTANAADRAGCMVTFDPNLDSVMGHAFAQGNQDAVRCGLVPIAQGIASISITPPCRP